LGFGHLALFEFQSQRRAEVLHGPDDLRGGAPARALGHGFDALEDRFDRGQVFLQGLGSLFGDPIGLLGAFALDDGDIAQVLEQGEGRVDDTGWSNTRPPP
jgi:hypothetical protein